MIFDDYDGESDPFPNEPYNTYPCQECGGQGWMNTSDWVFAIDPTHPTEFMCSYCGGQGRTYQPPARPRESIPEEDRCCNASFGERCVVDWECPSAPYAKRKVLVDLPLLASNRTAVFRQSELDALNFLLYRIEKDGTTS
jgi:hypothetical protein